AQDPEEVVQKRMSKAADEMSHYREYGYVIVNDKIDASVEEVQTILTAERTRIGRQMGLHEFVQELRESD
ncbi:MAG: guanylate kinase, partial [Rhodospirillaceae bacterium]|nr:guanylate kinase [Rhodospirillaceae bacterium]